MNAIDLTDFYRLLSLWRLEENGQWKLDGIERSANALYRCRHDSNRNLYAFLPSFCPANFHGGNHGSLVPEKLRQAPKCSK